MLAVPAVTISAFVSRYSQLYIERGKRQPDSERMRVRLFALIRKIIPDYVWWEVAQATESQQGVNVSATGLQGFYNDSAIRDVLDSITTIYDLIIHQMTARHLADIWKKAVANIFDEENLFYKVDASGIVQPFIDTEFEINRASALEVLEDPRFGEARKDFDAVYRHLKPRLRHAGVSSFSKRFALFESPNEETSPF